MRHDLNSLKIFVLKLQTLELKAAHQTSKSQTFRKNPEYYFMLQRFASLQNISYKTMLPFRLFMIITQEIKLEGALHFRIVP